MNVDTENVVDGILAAIRGGQVERMSKDSRKDEVRIVKEVLKALARVENADGDTKEIVYDRELEKIRSLDRTTILETINEAVNRDPKLLKFAPYAYSELSDVPGIEKVFAELLASAGTDGRAAIIQTIGVRRMRSLVVALNDHFTREYDDFCRDQLLHALGRIADESSLPIFTYVMSSNSKRDEWRILCAAISYARLEFHEYLIHVFKSSETKKPNRIMAAWGLAKLKNKQAYDYLISLLDDPERTSKKDGVTTYDPGQSLRAAQAISDINGWDFEWDKHSVDIVKERLQSSSSAS